MISDAVIRAALGRELGETDFPGLGLREKGKVRDCYRKDGRIFLVATDRISAFDRVLGLIPFKGQVLNQTAAFWFEKTRRIAPNHMLDAPDPNVMVAEECEQLSVEFVVRGYITGVTKTSLWHNYSNGMRNYCGHVLPEGLRKDQKLPTPILTPTTKFEAHDRPLSRREIMEEGLLDAETFDSAAELCLRLYEFGVKFAAGRGLILVDTKYELGRRGGRLVVSDEIHTPDSSRYWHSDGYHALFERGRDQRGLDKEYVRKWYADHGFRGEGEPPPMPEEVKIEAAKRYILAYELITGLKFKPASGEPLERIAAALKRTGYLQAANAAKVQKKETGLSE